MSSVLTWVVNFSKNDYLKDDVLFLSDPWIKYSYFTDIFDEPKDSNYDYISDYFKNETYKNLLHRFWGVYEISNKFNLIIISDKENVFLASLFAIEFKKSDDFLIKIGLPSSCYKKSYMVSFWEHAWSNKEYEKNIFGLFELTLLQNTTPLTRPFDNVFFYKNSNEGKSKYGKYYDTNDAKFHASRCLQMISYLSIFNSDSCINKNSEQWARSFGGLILFNDSGRIYQLNAENISSLIFDSIQNNENNVWSIDYYQNQLDNYTKHFECVNIFREITLNSTVDQKTEAIHYENAWDWFNLKKLQLFFGEIIKSLLFKTKEIKLTIIQESFKTIRNKVDENLKKMDSNPNHLVISSPEQIFDSYFKQKPFSIAALKIGMDELVKIVEKKRSGLFSFYSSGFKINEDIFYPFGVDEKSKKELEFITVEFQKNGDFKLIEDEKTALISLEKAASSIPHPVSLILKSFILGTLLALLVFIPLTMVINHDASFYEGVIFYSILSLLFSSPFLINFLSYRNALVKVKNLRFTYEILVKFNLTRRVNNYLFKKIDTFFDSYLKKCSQYQDKIDAFIQKINSKAEIKLSHQNNIQSLVSIIPLSEIVNEIPKVFISLETNSPGILVSELNNSEENQFKLFKKVIIDSDLTLGDILSDGQSVLSKSIYDNILNTIDNSTNVTSAIFGANLNIKNEAINGLLNVIPPSNGINNEDSLNIEISYVKSHEINVESIEKFVSPLSISTYNDLSENDGNIERIHIVSFNQPRGGIKSLFSLSITKSFYEVSKDYSEKYKERLDYILNFIYDNAVKYFGETLPEKFLDNNIIELSFNYCLKSFDGGFDEDFNNPKINFSKSFKEYNHEIIQKKLNIYIKKAYPDERPTKDAEE